MRSRKRANKATEEELREARSQLAVLEDEVLRLTLASQRDSETAKAFTKLRQLPDALPSSEGGDEAWQALAEAIWTRDLLVQACGELTKAVDEIKASLLEMPALDSNHVGLVVELGPKGNGELGKGEICLECGKGPFKRLSTHMRVHANANGEVESMESAPATPFEVGLRRDMARE